MKISCPWRDVYQQLGSEVCLASCCQGYCLQKIINCMHRILVGLLLMQGPVYECPAGCPSLRALHIEHRNNHLILCIHYFRLLAAGVYEAPKPALWVKSVSGPPKSIDEYTDAVALIPASTGCEHGSAVDFRNFKIGFATDFWGRKYCSTADFRADWC